MGDKPGKALMQGLLTRDPRKRLGSGVNGFEDIRAAEYFRAGYEGGVNLFVKIVGRELDAPVTPSRETYCSARDIEGLVLSDEDELAYLVPVCARLRPCLPGTVERHVPRSPRGTGIVSLRPTRRRMVGWSFPGPASSKGMRSDAALAVEGLTV